MWLRSVSAVRGETARKWMSMAVAQVGIGQQLVKELRAQVTVLETDLLARSKDVAEFAEKLKAEYDRAREAERTAAGFTEWREGRITQSAAAWVLGTVFVRFCEDSSVGIPATELISASQVLVALRRPAGSATATV